MPDDIKPVLPPLPEPVRTCADQAYLGYTVEHMRAYARAAVLADREGRQQKPPAITEGDGAPIDQAAWDRAFEIVSAYLRERRMGASLGQVGALCDIVVFADAQRANPAPPPTPDRYVALKASGSSYAYVNDTQEGKTVKRYPILKGDGWDKAEKHAAALNAHDRAQRAKDDSNG